jgi:hypothetical protein
MDLEVIAVESVRGSRDPNLPIGTLRPWTTFMITGQLQSQHHSRTTDYATDGKEPDHNRENVLQSRCIFSNDTLNLDLVQELETDIEVEDCANADGTEKSDKQSLLLLFDLPDVPMQCEDYRHTAKEKNEDSEEDQSPYWDYIVKTKRGPRTHRSKPKKD